MKRAKTNIYRIILFALTLILIMSFAVITASADSEPDENSPVNYSSVGIEHKGLFPSSGCKICCICPIQPLGICLFVWLAIIILIIDIIRIFFSKKKGKAVFRTIVFVLLFCVIAGFSLNFRKINDYIRNHNTGETILSTHDRAMALIAEGRFDEACALLERDGDTETLNQVKYSRAEELFIQGKPISAYALLVDNGHPDSVNLQNRIEEQYPSVIFNFAKAGDILPIGNYRNGENGEEAPVEWILLDKTDDSVLLISKYGLDFMPFNTKKTSVSWEKSTLREWLNDGFLNACFSDVQKDVIISSRLDNGTSKNEKITNDKIFLLSIQEADRYADLLRSCLCSPYMEQQIIEKGGQVTDGNTPCSWWLRSSGGSQKNAVTVNENGEVKIDGVPVNSDLVAIRPAIRINLISETDEPDESSSSSSSTTKADEQTQGRNDPAETKHTHTPVTVPGKPATCLSDGLTDGSKCSECGKTLNAQTVISALGHDWDEGKSASQTSILYTCRRCGETKTVSTLDPGTFLTFGRYQNEDIVWRVLAVEDGRILVISEKVLESRAVDIPLQKTCWEKCSLRKWLNSDFLAAAFNESEMARILTTSVSASIFKTGASMNDTEDKIFLLSYEETKQYFPDYDDRICSGTDHANSQELNYENGGCLWWLRTSETADDYFMFIVSGKGDIESQRVNYYDVGVRPAMWITP